MANNHKQLSLGKEDNLNLKESWMAWYRRFSAKLQAGAFVFALVGFITLNVGASKLKLALLATEDAIDIQSQAKLVLYYDEALTMNSWVASFSGNQDWVDRYFQFRNLTNTAISKVQQRLEPAVAAEFLAHTITANTNLRRLEEQLLELIGPGVSSQNLTAARSILASNEYDSNKILLKEGVEIVGQQVQVRLIKNKEVSEQISLLENIFLSSIGASFFCLAIFSQLSVRLHSKEDEQRLFKAMISKFNKMKTTSKVKAPSAVAGKARIAAAEAV